ncbi:hypothetical protein K438DRAFT_1750174 [Mycena galopus ATCC 62051]|nr:hypothetical protein K438DRAFT_1750174 [Mycena galopus ATCC 62051]
MSGKYCLTRWGWGRKILPARIAARLPIRTFSSGPTNSMCGAAFLVKNEIDKENMLVVDIGVFGLRIQRPSLLEIRIALGGGWIVRKFSTAAELRIGPGFLGYHIQTRALVFGGDVATATDYAVVAQGLPGIGNAGLVPTAVKHKVTEYNSAVIQMLERVIGNMKTTDADILVLFIGGGAMSRAPRVPAVARTPGYTWSRIQCLSPGASGVPWLSVAPRTKSIRSLKRSSRQSGKDRFRGAQLTVKGHVYGEVVISASDVSGGLLKISFKNKDIIAIAVDVNQRAEVVASVPDLISVSDASTGEAIGTPEYRYGLLVFVIGIQASEKWTSMMRGLQIGGLRAFGMDVDYKPQSGR